MANNVINEVDVFGLFNALYSKGSAKLSDHFINREDTTTDTTTDTTGHHQDRW
jgi:hypothetical protein